MQKETTSGTNTVRFSHISLDVDNEKWQTDHLSIQTSWDDCEERLSSVDAPIVSSFLRLIIVMTFAKRASEATAQLWKLMNWIGESARESIKGIAWERAREREMWTTADLISVCTRKAAESHLTFGPIEKALLREASLMKSLLLCCSFYFSLTGNLFLAVPTHSFSNLPLCLSAYRSIYLARSLFYLTIFHFSSF